MTGIRPLMPTRARFSLPFLWVFLFVSQSLFAQEFLEGLLWVALDPVDPIEIEREPLDDQALARGLLEQAREYFSAMIYGYEINYVPQDGRREVPETLELKPLALIPSGDPRLRVRSSWIDPDQGRFYALLIYQHDRISQQRVSSWERMTSLKLQGTALSDPGRRWEMESQALERAVREGLIAYFRQRYPNKPRQIIGTLALREFPRFSQEAGRARARVEFYFLLEELRPYFR